MTAGLLLRVQGELDGSGAQHSKEGVLLLPLKEPRKVTIVHRKRNGDVLVQDGPRLLMIASHAVETAVENEGKRLLALVKSVYAKFSSGELDIEWLLREAGRLNVLI